MKSNETAQCPVLSQQPLTCNSLKEKATFLVKDSFVNGNDIVMNVSFMNNKCLVVIGKVLEKC